MLQDNHDGNVVGALQSLKSGADLIRSNGKTPFKGLTKEMKAQWANDIAVVLSGPQPDLEVIWDDLASFPTEVTVEGVSRAWERMSSELRQAYRKHMRLLNAEKEASQRFSLILHFLESDPMSALEMFCDMAPKNADNVKRAIKSLLSQDYQTIQRLFAEEAQPANLAKAAEVLVILIQHEGVEHKTRWAAAKAVLSALSRRNLMADPQFADTIKALGTIAMALPSTYQSDLKGLVGIWKGEGKDLPPNEPPHPSGESDAPFSVPPPRFASNQELSPSQTGPPAITDIPANENLHESDIRSKPLPAEDWQEFICHWRNSLKNQAEMLDLILSYEDPHTVNSLREQLADALEAQHKAETRAAEARLFADEFERKATEAAQRSRNLETHLDNLRTRLQQAQSELADAMRESLSLRAEMESRIAEHSREIHDLNQHISANAELRLSEFRERLASGLRDLLSKIPPSGTNVNAELGGILLLRLHEVMDRLEAVGGIGVRSKGTAV